MLVSREKPTYNHGQRSFANPRFVYVAVNFWSQIMLEFTLDARGLLACQQQGTSE